MKSIEGRFMLLRFLKWSLGFLAVLLLNSGCEMKTDDAPFATPEWYKGSKAIDVIWTANKETAVNASGGGYHVYAGNKADFDLLGAPNVDVPYVSGPTAPTTVRMDKFKSGTYYFKIVAYSSRGESNNSTAISATIP
jgi:hypothetical protein